MTDFKTDNSYVVIKGRFKAIASSAYGLFIVFMDNLTKNVEKSDLVASHFSTIYDNNNPNMPWSEMEQIITRMKWKGEYATTLTHDIQASIDDLFQPNTGRGLDVWNGIKKGQINKVVAIFEEYLVRPTGDKGIKVDVTIETVTKSEIDDIRRGREQRENKDVLKMSQPAPQPQTSASDLKLEDSAVVLEVALVLSPVSGKPILELKEGEKILVKISEQTGRGQYFIDLLNASQDNEILPVPASVIRVSKEGKLFTVLVSIGPGIYGKSVDEDTVKVKLFDASADKSKVAAPVRQPEPAQAAATMTADIGLTPDKKNKPVSNGLIFALIGVAVIVVIVVLIFMFI
jgi:hypothetical protein